MKGFKHFTLLLLLAFSFLQMANSLPQMEVEKSMATTSFPKTDVSFDFERKVQYGEADIRIDYEILSQSLTRVSYQFDRDAETNPIEFSYQYNIQSATDGSDLEAIALLKPNLFNTAKEAKIEANSPGLVNYPDKLQVGMSLPDADFDYSIVLPDVIFQHKGKVIDRKVVRSFKGTFQNQPITGYVISAKIIRNSSLNGNSIEETSTELQEWLVDGMGIVKQERSVIVQPIGFVDTHKKAMETETVSLKNLSLHQ